MLLRPRQPFNFSQTLRFVLQPPALLNGKQFPPLLDYFEDGEFRRAVDFDGDPVLYGVTETPSPTRQLQVRILAGRSDAGTAVLEQVRRQFSTDLDLGPFGQICALDPVLSRLWSRFA